MDRSYHVPVMLDETLDALAILPDGTYVDGTFGGGGHAEGILRRLGPDGTLFGCDADRIAIEEGRKRFEGETRLQLRHGYFSDVCREFADEGITLSGVLLDLGVSSRQLDSDQIGLSYREEMPLDMRFDPERRDESAADIVNRYPAGDLASLLRQYGEEPAAWKIAQAIESARRARPITTTAQLRAAIESAIPERFLIKTLSRVFQALRIAVNDELGELVRGLDGYIGLLRPGGRIVVLTYHSLEDRIVKRAFREEERKCTCPPGLPECMCGSRERLRLVHRKPLTPSEEEIERNPRARSAKLRVAERVLA